MEATRVMMELFIDEKLTKTVITELLTAMEPEEKPIDSDLTQVLTDVLTPMDPEIQPVTKVTFFDEILMDINIDQKKDL